VHFFGRFQTDDAIHLAMEYVPLGDLENNLKELEISRHIEGQSNENMRGVLSKEEVKDITTHMLEGVKIMHAEGFLIAT
jgi:calcium/calmodulin-dependent protein kinase I